jgi:hypothetical protein
MAEDYHKKYQDEINKLPDISKNLIMDRVNYILIILS